MVADPTKYKNFRDMTVSLRAGAASGMNVVITLEPDSAIYLAEIIETFDKLATAEIKRMGYGT
tara:strand:+ start:313 stop:501 length:189 start_codon:yes stop_codon:yes gene_type:complete